ncbi:beta-1,3-galactosyltransferase 1-like [Ruditapes philippinarum]|uniref:beta-1,3-galactosyltransferase 1-like n=1 Tax=Ruditapes philippinarum TaxID=129788 RepID=UPI00295B7336|nr:beta-1,3-galactosyltransferase 1-like [Ruditapes philippinarum]
MTYSSVIKVYSLSLSTKFVKLCLKTNCLRRFLLIGSLAIAVSYVGYYLFSDSIIQDKTSNSLSQNHRLHVYLGNIDNDPYIKSMREKFPLKMISNLSKLINATNPKYALTINSSYLIENPNLCKRALNFSVLVIVNSATDNFERRQAIRATWTNDSYYHHLGKVKVMFLLGKPLNNIVQEMIKRESEAYADILQGDFVDTYFNLTHKGVMSFKWIQESCRNPKHILKVDDDILVNMFLYFEHIQNTPKVRDANVYCHYGTSPVVRKQSIKWYISDNHFRGVKYYLNFCRGKFVSMTNDIIPSLYLSASKTPFFKLDDVLLYGYVMHNIPSLKYETLAWNEMQEDNGNAIKCFETLKDKCQLVIMQASGIHEMSETWSTVLKYFKK